MTNGQKLLHVRVDEPARTVAITGELDHASAPDLVEAAAQLLTAPGPLTVDMAALSFIDAGGLSALAVLYGWQRAAGQSLTVVRTIPRIRRTIVIGGLGVVLAPA